MAMEWRPYEPCLENEVMARDCRAFEQMLDRHAASLRRFPPQPHTQSHYALAESLRQRRQSRRWDSTIRTPAV